MVNSRWDGMWSATVTAQNEDSGSHRRRAGVARGLFATLLLAALPPGAGIAQAPPPPPPALTPPPPAIVAPAAPVWKVSEPDGRSDFANPILRGAADPWLTYDNGWYYLLHTVGWGVGIRRAHTLGELATVQQVAVWRGGGPAGSGYEAFRKDEWAPELHKLRGKWYVYYCATDSTDGNRRLFCLEAKTDDPLGPYEFKGKVSPPGDDAYAIDPTVFERPSDHKLFLLWSGREAETKGAQNIYIAPLSDPWTISGPRVRLSTPTYPWELHGWRVNEGPEVLLRNGKTFVTYSASGGTTSHYCLGLLENDGPDLLDPKAWKKRDHPVLESFSSPAGPLYTTGHNGFFTAPDGKSDWIVFHAKTVIDNTWRGRDAYAAPISSLPQLDREMR